MNVQSLNIRRFFLFINCLRTLGYIVVSGVRRANGVQVRESCTLSDFCLSSDDVRILPVVKLCYYMFCVRV